MGKRRIIILGAGLAGLSAAWHLQKKGVECLVFEKEKDVGGLCRSKKINGFTFDFSGHLLHFRHAYTFDFIKNLLGDSLVKHKRKAWVYSHGAYNRYPFQANLHGLPPTIIKECLIGFVEAALRKNQIKSKERLNFLDWINFTFGYGIAKHFMVPYNTKFWTIPLYKMACGWLDGFVPVPSVTQLVAGIIKENPRQFGYNVNFWYPQRGGIAILPLAMANMVKNIHLNCKVVDINIKKREITLASGEREKFDYLLSTVPLPEKKHLIKDFSRDIIDAFAKLKWNSIFNLNLGVCNDNKPAYHWTYFPQRELSFFRIGFFHNFSRSMAPQGKSSLYAEVSYSKDKPINKHRIVARIKHDLEKIGILKGNDMVCAEDITDIQYGYPIYDLAYGDARIKIIDYLRSKGIIPLGRYGSWRYMSMEDAILEGSKVIGFLKENA